MSEEDQNRLRKQFWLETNDDFVIVDKTIDHPWIEHLMQRFSHGFIRIGINGATKDDFSTLIYNI